MNIALITNDFYPVVGGITTTLLNVSEKVRDLGNNVYVLNNSYDDNKNSFNIIVFNKSFKKDFYRQGFRFYFIMIQIFFKNLFFFKGVKLKTRLLTTLYNSVYPDDLVNRVKSVQNLISFFKKNKIDIVLSGTSSYPLNYSFIVSKWFNLPLVSIAHGDDFLKKYPLNLNSLIFQNIDKIVVTNKTTKNLFLKLHNVNENKVSIINLGVDIKKSIINQSKSDLREKFNIPKNVFVILTVSRLHFRKGIEIVISAIKSIIDDNPDILLKYYIIGKGPEEVKLKNLVSELNLNKHIEFLGGVDDELRNQFYKLSDLFVLVPITKKDPTQKSHSIEGFGIIYIEASYFKLPVIGSSSGGSREAIIDGKTGYLIKSDDVISLKEKIMFLYNNKKIREELGAYGQTRVIDYFDWRKIALKYQDLFRNLIMVHKS